MHSRVLASIPDFICNIIFVVELQWRAYSTSVLVHITDTHVFIYHDYYFYLTLEFSA